MKVKIEFKSKMVEGINYPILKADKNGRVKCPFCFEEHKHGIGGGDGHRVADCTTLLINNPRFTNGLWCDKSNGYYVEFPKK
jgi:hypothetical protein